MLRGTCGAMGTTKRAAARPAPPPPDGDLFPRGRAAGSVPRVRRRDGTVLFGGAGGGGAAADAAAPARKRARAEKPVTAPAEKRARGLSAKRLAIGMSLFGVVTAVGEEKVEVALPGGVRAQADPMEVLLEGHAGREHGGLVVQQPKGRVAGEVGSDEESAEEEEEEDEMNDDAEPRPLWRVVNAGDLVRVAVVSAEKAASSGSVRVTVSLRPSLINVSHGVVGGGGVAAAASAVLRKGETAWGAVSAVEDHGYVVNFGGSVPTLGFLAFADAPASRLAPGAPVDVLVRQNAQSGHGARNVVAVSADAGAVAAATAASFPGMTIGALRAGARVRAKVAAVRPAGGLELRVFGLFSAFVEPAHVPPDAGFSAGAAVDARLLYVDAGSKRVGATLLPALVEARAPRSVPRAWAVGTVVSSVVVARVEPGYGVVLHEVAADGADGGEGPNEAADVPLFAHASRVSDERVEKLESVFHRGLRIDGGARIVSFNPLDGVVSVDLRPSILARKALSVAEVRPGERYECKVVGHSLNGSVFVGVDGDEHIRGIVPQAHLSDTAVSAKKLALHSRYKVGATLSCICMAVDLEKGKAFLTSKRSLLNSEHAILSSYEQALAAIKTDSGKASGDAAVFDGTVATVTEGGGVLVVFPGGVRGLVAERELFPAQTDGKKPAKRTRAQVEALYPSGQTVTARVLHVSVDDERMSLSFNLKRTSGGIQGRSGPAVGSFVSGNISSIDQEARVIFVNVMVPVPSGGCDEPGSATTLPSSPDASKIQCRLPFDHLSDFADLSARIAAEFTKGTSASSSPMCIEDALVLTDVTGSRAPVISMKTSLVVAARAGHLPRTFEDVEAILKKDKAATSAKSGSKDDSGDDSADEKSPPRPQRTVLRGYVKAAQPTGILVGFLGNLVGIARKSRISDDFVADPLKTLARDQSVCAVLEEVDVESSRFTLSLRHSDIGSDATVDDTIDYFGQVAAVTDRFGCPSVESDFPVGAVVESILDKSRPYGMVLSLTSTAGAKAFGVVLEQSCARSGSTMTPSGKTPLDMESIADSESIASAALATAAAHADTLASTPGERSAKMRQVAGAVSARKTRRKLALEANAATAATEARVLDVDPFTGVVDVSLDRKVVEAAGKRLLSSRTAKEVDATILLVKDEYVIFSVPRGKGKTVIGFALLPVISQQLRLLLQPGLVVQSRPITGRKLIRNLMVVDWVAVGSALSSKKNESVAKGMSVQKKSLEKKRQAKAKKEGKHPSVGPGNVEVGSTVAGKVTHVFPLQINVAIARGLVGRVHITNCLALSEGDVNEMPLGPVCEDAANRCCLPGKKDDVVKGLRVLAIRDSKTASDGEGDVYTQSKPVLVELGRTDGLAPISGLVEAGSRVIGVVKNVKRGEGGTAVGLWLELTPTVTAYCAGIDSLPVLGHSATFEDVAKLSPVSFTVGTLVACSVASAPKSGEEGQVQVVVSANGSEPTFLGRVLSMRKGEGIRVELPWLARRKGQKDKRWGLVNMCDISDDYDEAVALCESVKVGTFVRVSFIPSRQTAADLGDDIVLLSMRSSVITDPSNSEMKIKDPVLPASLQKEDLDRHVRGFVRSVGKSGCFVCIGTFLVARVLLSNLADAFVSKPVEAYPPGMLVAGKISFVDGNDGTKVQLTLRKRKRQALKGDRDGDQALQTAKKAKQSSSAKSASFVEGTVVKTVVSRIEKFGAIVSVTDHSNISALLHKSEADQDRKVADPWSEWKIGQRLTAVALKPGDDGKCRVGTKRCYFEAAGLDEDQVDEILETNASKVDSEPLEKAASAPVPTASLTVEDGDVEMGRREIAGDNDTVAVVENDDESEGEEPSDAGRDSESESESEIKGESQRQDETDVAEEKKGKRSSKIGKEASSSNGLPKDVSRPDSDSDSDAGSHSEASDDGAALPIARGFLFDDDAECNRQQEADVDSTSDAGSDAASGDEGISEGPQKKSSREKREKKRAKDAAEREIREREEALANHPDTPETAEDFERLLMGKPNASEVWIRFMAFRVSLSQFEKARAVAERALETIALHEELERVNVWIAYINLEATCSAGGEVLNSSEMSAAALKNRAAAVFRVFDRACQRVTDVKDFHLQVAAALRLSAPELADEVLQRALKSFKRSTDVWSAVGVAQFSSGKLEAGRQTLEKALLSLEKPKHVTVIMKFAQLEYRYGSSERGRTVFSSLCANFPKRLDLWSVYLDMEIGRYRSALKADDEAEKEAGLASVRLLFEKCLSLDLSTKKTKFVFKRWLNFEVEAGDKDAQDRVRSKARAYVETKLVPS